MSKPQLRVPGRPNLYFHDGVWRVNKTAIWVFWRRNDAALLHAIKLNEQAYETERRAHLSVVK